jgi:signal transduction histidine kinase
MSIATKISLLVSLLLGLCGTIAGLAFYDSVKRSVDSELEARLNVRLAWLEAGLALEYEGIEFDAQGEPRDAAEFWSISLPDGRVVLHSKEEPAQEMGTRDLRSSRRVITVTMQEGWPVRAEHEEQIEEEDDEEGEEEEDDEEENGEEENDEDEDEPEKRRASMELVLTARTSVEDAVSELGRLRTAMFTVGPLALVVTAVILVLLIRWQLSPLARMAEEAGRIGPENISLRLPVAGTAVEYVKLRAALNAMVERLAEGLSRERRFSSTAAHELRTPLAQLKTGVEVALRREREASEYREALSDALSDVERLDRLVAGLLQLTRNQRPDGVQGRRVRVAAMLEKALSSAGPAEVLPGLPEDVCVTGEEELLSAALANVLKNAHRYAPGRPPEVRASMEGDRVLLTVSDRGPGVPQNEQERIFEPLTRLDPARSVGDRADGFGLGLAVARSTVRAFGGDLTCTGRPDGEPGAVFTFLLPVAP